MINELSLGDMVNLCHTASPFVSLSSIVFVINATPKESIVERVKKFEKKLAEIDKHLGSAYSSLSNNEFLKSAPQHIIDGKIEQLIRLQEEQFGYSRLLQWLEFSSNYKLQRG